MRICTTARLETWSPDFSSSEQADPTWTRVSMPEGQATNALNWIDWDESPIQVVLCESCGFEGCATGGYVHASRLGPWLLWTRPQDEPDAMDEEPEHALVRRFGGVAIGDEAWERWRSHVRDLPPLDRFPAANGRVLADAWRMAVVGPGRSASLGDVVPTLRRALLHADTLGVEGAIDAMGHAVDHLQKIADDELRGALVHPASLGVQIERLYFDAPEVCIWPALALGRGDPLLALGEELVFVPEP